MTLLENDIQVTAEDLKLTESEFKARMWGKSQEAAMQMYGDAKAYYKEAQEARSIVYVEPETTTMNFDDPKEEYEETGILPNYLYRPERGDHVYFERNGEREEGYVYDVHIDEHRLRIVPEYEQITTDNPIWIQISYNQVFAKLCVKVADFEAQS